ncbi:hypothetical protein FTUN_6880 [Frigoriglobus tundricola]|uniref:Uncharacterized protein n=1 Tax=Frigoriglobus tundricola TaxID=2774151 RepID=A0A6M5YZI2_9BACT|nr:hypothetical protein FTUN_6880 [Frigoriglobus tundricola]
MAIWRCGEITLLLAMHHNFLIYLQALHFFSSLILLVIRYKKIHSFDGESYCSGWSLSHIISLG